MKKLFVLAALGLAIYVGYRKRDLFEPREGAFDKEGRPIVRVFVGPDCGGPCAEIEEMLARRRVQYERVDISTPEAQQYGVQRYPTTVVGRRRVLGSALQRLVSVLAETYGDRVLTYNEQIAMAGHFDANGKPRVVLYGTRWCPGCARQREYFTSRHIPFVDVDVEGSPSAQMAYDALLASGYPLIYVGYRRFEGYHEADIEQALAELT
jgi:glutaredoxin-related protein